MKIIMHHGWSGSPTGNRVCVAWRTPMPAPMTNDGSGTNLRPPPSIMLPDIRAEYFSIGAHGPEG